MSPIQPCSQGLYSKGQEEERPWERGWSPIHHNTNQYILETTITQKQIANQMQSLQWPNNIIP